MGLRLGGEGQELQIERVRVPVAKHCNPTRASEEGKELKTQSHLLP